MTRAAAVRLPPGRKPLRQGDTHTHGVYDVSRLHLGLRVHPKWRIEGDPLRFELLAQRLETLDFKTDMVDGTALVGACISFFWKSTSPPGIPTARKLPVVEPAVKVFPARMPGTSPAS